MESVTPFSSPHEQCCVRQLEEADHNKTSKSTMERAGINVIFQEALTLSDLILSEY